MCLAVPGRIEAIFERDGTRLGRVSFDGIIKEVCLEFLPEAGIGDYALVHVGFAITKIDEATAQASLATLRELGMLADRVGGGTGMKHVSEFRDAEVARRLADQIRATVTRPWAIMEVCGGQTHAILRHGLDQLLPREVGANPRPGCPVCVTPVAQIDRALAIAARPGVIFCSFGDMLRVPGSASDLFRVKSQGGDVRVVYSPLDAVQLAKHHPDRQVVFFAIGFETTAPANALAVVQAQRLGLNNFSLFVSHVLVPPALEAILSAPGQRVQAILAAGHVCSVMGTWQYPPLAARYRVPIVVTGFEPLDLLEGIRRAVAQLEAGRAEVENAYPRAVTKAGNRRAQELIAEVFETTDREWRGLGRIPQSGWQLRAAYRHFDAEQRFSLPAGAATVDARCRSGEVLQGLLRPSACPAFGKECTPRTPLGATMVSSEGACAAYFHYGRLQELSLKPQLVGPAS